MILVRHSHMRTLKYCNKGARAFAKRHNLDWHQFVNEGIPEEQLLATGDAMVIPVVELARAEWAEKASQ